MVVNIWNEAYYDEYRLAIDWNADRIAEEKFAHRKDDFLQASLHIVRTLDELFENEPERFKEQINTWREAERVMKYNGFLATDRLWKPSNASSLVARFAGLILSAPIALFGCINGIFPLLLNRKLKGLFKDKQFISSARYASGLIFVPIFALLQSLVLGGVVGDWLLALVYLFAMPLTFYFFLRWREGWKKAVRDRKVHRFAKQAPETWKKLVRATTLGWSFSRSLNGAFNLSGFFPLRSRNEAVHRHLLESPALHGPCCPRGNLRHQVIAHHHGQTGLSISSGRSHEQHLLGELPFSWYAISLTTSGPDGKHQAEEGYPFTSLRRQSISVCCSVRSFTYA